MTLDSRTTDTAAYGRLTAPGPTPYRNRPVAYQSLTGAYGTRNPTVAWLCSALLHRSSGKTPDYGPFLSATLTWGDA
jgi:hypothetical protein